MRSALALVALVAVAACGQQAGAHYALGYSIANGAAVLPPTASRGTTAMIGYHEEGGIVARTIILVIVAMGLKDPNGDTSTSTSVKREEHGDYATVTTTTTTTFTPTTPEERAAREQAIRDFNDTVAPGIMHDGMPVALDMGWARPSLGGDTRGFTFDMMYQATLSPTTGLAFGFGYRDFTFHDRTVANVTSDNLGTATATRTMGPTDYTFVGIPVKLTQFVANRTSVFVQWDLNIMSLVDNSASPITLGLYYRLPVLSLKGTVMTDRFDPRAFTYGIEALVGF